MIWDTVMGNQELDMFECRLVELEAIPDLIHVVVEANIDHQGHPKPYHFTEHLGRFDAWRDRIRIVQATDLPSVEADSDPWSREHAQREYAFAGIVGCDPGDVVLHGDIDEIPTAVAVRNVRPTGFVAFQQRFHPFAVDWLHPDIWTGTVAALASNISTFSAMRVARNFAPSIPNAGWHFSWVGGREYTLDKLGSFCHPEIADRTLAGLEADEFMQNGWHVDGKRLLPVEVGRNWPKWIQEGNCPGSWFRPRDAEDDGWTPPTGR